MSKYPRVTPETLSQLRHDLRTPIGQIIGYAELLLEEVEAGEVASLRADLERIRRAGEHLLTLLDAQRDALSSETISSAEVALALTAFDIGAPRTAAEQDADSVGGHILVVDDIDENRELLVRRLEHQGQICRTASSGEEALTLLATHPFDLVLLDVMMPGMDGYQVLKRIKSDPATHTTPVVMISAVEDVESVVRCLEMGAADYLPKPFNPVLLRARVGSCLRDKRRQDREAALFAELQKNYRRERRIADALQRPLLRDIPEDAFPNLAVATLYEAALSEAQVGGDLFDAFSLPEGRVALAIADASGKGLAAAARASQVKYALRAYAREFADDPASVVSHLNAFLCESEPASLDQAGGFVCLSFLVIDPQTGDVKAVLAGCEPPLVLRADGSAASIEDSSPPIGITAEVKYRTVSAHLDSGDTLVLCTDGITEARQGRSFLGYEGLIELAGEGRTAPTIHGMAESILEGARRFSGGSLRDDACLLLARRLQQD